MAHRVFSKDSKVEAEYSWRTGNQSCKLQAHASGTPSLPAEGSLEQFITEHYWGYSRQSDGGTVEYHVSHVPWKVWPAAYAEFSVDTRDLYGKTLQALSVEAKAAEKSHGAKRAAYFFAATAPVTFSAIFGVCSSVLCTRQCSTASSTPFRCSSLNSTGASTSITKFVMRASGSFTFSHVTRTRVPSVASLFFRRYCAV